MGVHPLPTEVTYAKLLAETLGKPAEVKKNPVWNPKPTDRLFSALYVNDSGKNTVLCLCDLALSCSLGAFLTMVPAGVAKDAVKSGEVPEIITENVKEVFNITASLFNRKGSPHVKLGAVFLAPPLPEDVAGLIAQPGERCDFQVTVPNYGSGLVSFRWIE